MESIRFFIQSSMHLFESGQDRDRLFGKRNDGTNSIWEH